MRNFVFLCLAHLCICLSVILEYRVPSYAYHGNVRRRVSITDKIRRDKNMSEPWPLLYSPKLVGPRDGTIFPCAYSSQGAEDMVRTGRLLDSRASLLARSPKLRRTRDKAESSTHICDPLEQDGFMTRPFGIRKSANCLGGLVFKASKELMKLLHTNSFQKPFSVNVSCHKFVFYLSSVISSSCVCLGSVKLEGLYTASVVYLIP